MVTARSIKLNKEETDRYTEVNGVKLHYNEAGSGHALLCFHGGGPGANAWDNSKWCFGDFAEHFRTLLVDLPAYGESDMEQKLGRANLARMEANGWAFHQNDPQNEDAYTFVGV